MLFDGQHLSISLFSLAPSQPEIFPSQGSAIFATAASALCATTIPTGLNFLSLLLSLRGHEVNFSTVQENQIRGAAERGGEDAAAEIGESAGRHLQRRPRREGKVSFPGELSFRLLPMMHLFSVLA